MPARQQPPRPRPTHRGVGSLRRGTDLLRGLLATALLTTLVAGTPWGLALYIGWPLPHHLIAWPEIEAVLLAPMSTNFLLHTLACVLWLVWAAFAVDVARATVDEIRAVPRPTVPHVGPLNTLAAALVGAIILALISQRPTAAASSAPHGTRTVAAMAIAPTALSVNLVDFTQPVRAAKEGQFRTGRTSGTVEVEPPRAGIYDSLWRIAARTLGDGSRWPEIYALNRGHPQPDGRSLTTPNLIRPGWILHLPNDPSRSGSYDPGQHRPPSSPPSTSVPTTPKPSPSPDTSPSTQPHSGTPATPSPPRAPAQPLPTRDPHHQPGINLPTGAFVGIGLAAVIAAALLVVRRRHRVRYRPGSGDRDDLTIAPVVRALRLAHDDATRADETAVPDDTTDPLPHPRPALSWNSPSTGGNPVAPVLPPTDERVIGVKDGQELAWNIARARGLGLIGPGAPDAIRALLVALLAEPSAPTAGVVEILIPDFDARMLIGEHIGYPARLRVVDDLDAALDTMEAELLARTNTGVDAAQNAVSSPVDKLVLVATPLPHADRRLQGILDNGSTLGLAGVLLGQWRPGGTARVRSNGTVAATSSSVADVLAGARLFTMPAPDTQVLLDLLRDAQPAQHPSAQGTSVTSLNASGQRDRDNKVQVLRGTSTSSRRRLARGPAPRADVQQETPTDEHVPPDPDNDEPDPSTPLVTGSSCDPRTAIPDDPSSLASAATSRPTEFGSSNATKQVLSVQPPLQLTVLGRIRLTHHQALGAEHADLSPVLAPKQREVLAYLALHRDGARREALAAAIWPAAPRDRPYNSFHATLSQLRRALRTATHDALNDITVHADGHYGLDHDQIAVDLWHLQDALHSSRHDTGERQHLSTLERVVELYSGDFAPDLAAEWAEAPREALRRDVLDTVSALVRIIRDDEPEHALALLERARTLDRYNEAIYRDIARFQAHLRRYDAIPRTLTLLTTTLAEIDEEPSRETVGLCDFLQHPQPTKNATSGRTTG